jgi:hypothetical protein
MDIKMELRNISNENVIYIQVCENASGDADSSISIVLLKEA